MDTILLNTSFNSKLVRLKAKMDTSELYRSKSFNSKLVRLKDEKGFSYAEVPALFQFQTGAIKSEIRI